MINKVLRATMGVIVAFLVIAIVSQALIFIGPFIGGVVAMVLDLTPDSRMARNMEAVGNIFVLIVSIYAGVKVYKKIIGKQVKMMTLDESEDTQSEEEIDSNYEEVQEPKLSDEENQEQAEKVQKIHILCQLAEVHLDDLSDEYESNKLMERIDKATEMAKDIDDPFYSGAALHPIISLAHRAGWNDKKNELLEMVSDPFVKEKIMEDIDAENT